MKSKYDYTILNGLDKSADERIKWCLENLVSTAFNGNVEFCIKDGKLVVYGDLIIPDDYGELPIKIDEVFGDVVTENTLHNHFGSLHSLKNFPTKIHGMLKVSMNPNLASLQDGPKYIDASFVCNGCGLFNLDHLPLVIGGNLIAYSNKISDMKGVLKSKIGGKIDVMFNECVNTDIYRELTDYNKIIN